MTASNNTPLVSVIIPVYNGAEFIGAAIESAAKQTYANLEILIVDDGSTDGTLAILHAHASHNARIRVFTQSNGGVAKARNRAVEESRGTLIAPLDADDLWLPTKIERQVARMVAAGGDIGFVYCWWALIDDASAVFDSSPRWMVEGNHLDLLLRMNFTGNASVPLFRKSALVDAGGYNANLAAQRSGGCEDWELVLRVAATHAIAVVPEILLGYRRRSGSMSQACDTMKRSQQLVMQGIRKLRPDLTAADFRRSDRHFALHLAALSFWSGNRLQALRWALHSGIALPLFLSPFILRMLLRPRRQQNPQILQPGRQLDITLIPNAQIPYQRLLKPRSDSVIPAQPQAQNQRDAR